VQYKSVFLDHYYLLKNKKHVSYTSKTKSQDFDFFIKVTQLLATMTFRECGIFPLTPNSISLKSLSILNFSHSVPIYLQRVEGLPFLSYWMHITNMEWEIIGFLG
jgi:hypothetical protein